MPVSIGAKSTECVETVAKEPEFRKRSWRKKLAYLLLFVILLYPLSLVVVNTPWVKSKLTNKLAEKTGFQWEVGSIMWVPFGDIYVNDLKTVSAHEADSDTGWISLESISIAPIWSQAISGDLVWNEIRLDGVDVDVERAWLVEIMKKSSVSGLPQLKEAPKQVPPVRVKPVNPDKIAPPIAQQPKPIHRKPKTKKKEPTQKTAVTEQTLIITGLNIKVRDRDETWFKCDNISMDIPYAGKSRNGSIRIVDESGHEENLPVVWDEKNVVIDKLGIELFGINLDLKSRINTLAGSKMFAYQMIIHDQPYKYEIHRPNFHAKLKTDHLQGQFVMRGNLLSPQTWNGFGGIQFKQLSIQETQKTMKALEFDEVYAKGRMMQGSLLIDNAIARSDDLTFMANGVVRKDTYTYGVLRCVANESFSKELNRIYHGSHAIHLIHPSYHLFENLQTRDRKFFDLYFDGKLAQMEFKHNRSKQWQSLNQFLKDIKKFKDNELKEDGIYN